MSTIVPRTKYVSEILNFEVHDSSGVANWEAGLREDALKPFPGVLDHPWDSCKAGVWFCFPGIILF